MNGSTGLTAVDGLGNLGDAKRFQVYDDIRRVLGLDPATPMLDLPPAALRRWAEIYAPRFVEVMASNPATAGSADVNYFIGVLLEYEQAPDNYYLDSLVLGGADAKAAGLPGIYLHAFLNSSALPIAVEAAREVLDPQHASVIEVRYPVVMLLRHGLTQEGYLGVSALT